MIIAITGTPGTGKTTLATLLAKKLGYRYVNLNDLAAEKKLYCGYDRKRRIPIVDIARLSREVEKRGTENLILDAHYSHDLPGDLIILLRTNPRELRRRAARAGWPAAKTEENVQAEIMEVCRSEALAAGRPVLELDTTTQRPPELARRVIKAANQVIYKPLF